LGVVGQDTRVPVAIRRGRAAPPPDTAAAAAPESSAPPRSDIPSQPDDRLLDGREAMNEFVNDYGEPAVFQPSRRR